MQECWEEAACPPSYRGQEEIQGEDVDMACDIAIASTSWALTMLGAILAPYTGFLPLRGVPSELHLQKEEHRTLRNMKSLTRDYVLGSGRPGPQCRQPVPDHKHWPPELTVLCPSLPQAHSQP